MYGQPIAHPITHGLEHNVPAQTTQRCGDVTENEGRKNPNPFNRRKSREQIVFPANIFVKDPHQHCCQA